MPAVSVVIPTRNRHEALTRAIRSVLDQSFSDLEVVIVRDGPDADTVSTVAAFDDPRLRLVTLDVSLGGSEARNVGIRAACGTWIALLDDDDEWLPEKLALQVELALQQKSQRYVIGAAYYYSGPDRLREIWPAQLPQQGQHLSEFLFASRGGFQTSVYFVPRAFFLEIPFTTGLRKHQDWDWFLRCSAVPDFQLAWVAQPVSIYWAPATTSNSISNQRNWRFSFDWVNASRPLMTGRAYAMFVVRECARAAAMQKASIWTRLSLLKDLLTKGDLNPRLLAEFAATFVLNERNRVRLANWRVQARSIKA
jgi:glycosyltransferase involved in cell wall biosynthesis